MGCPIDGDGAELIVSYCAGKLSQARKAELELHFKSCAKCRELVDAQRAVWSALDEWPAAPVSPNFDRKLHERIAAGQQRAWRQRLWPENWSWRPAVPVAVACAALLAAFLLKTPALVPGAPHQPKLQIEQVEHALDDMDMLKQLSVETPDSDHSSERI